MMVGPTATRHFVLLPTLTSKFVIIWVKDPEALDSSLDDHARCWGRKLGYAKVFPVTFRLLLLGPVLRTMVGPIMSETAVRSETVDLLQELGLKEYEARCFLALAQLHEGTAKEISDISEVPRTRVYDATRVLEAKGLVEVQHSNPQQFRAVSIPEATSTLQQQYEDRIQTLQTRLENLEPPPEADDTDRLQEVWSMSGNEAIDARTAKILQDTDTELILLVIDDSILTDSLYDQLRNAMDRSVSVIVGGRTADVREDLREHLPGAQVFETELSWLVGTDEDISIGRLLLSDHTTLFVSSYYPKGGGDETERAVYATGLGNGIVVLIRRILATGLIPAADPEK